MEGMKGNYVYISLMRVNILRDTMCLRGLIMDWIQKLKSNLSAVIFVGIRILSYHICKLTRGTGFKRQ